MDALTPSPLRRRTVVGGLAWAAPAVTAAVAAPARAASVAGCAYTVDFTATAASTDPVTSLTAVSSTGQEVTVALTSWMSACTQATQANLWTRSDLAVGGTSDGSTCGEAYQPTGAPAGYLTLNQRAPMTGCVRDRLCGPLDGHPSQDLTLSFTTGGRPITGITGLEVDVYDISSVVRDAGAMGDQPSDRWMVQYKDTVAFGQAPSRILHFDPAAWGLDPAAYAGTGAGTADDPFMRLGDLAPTVPGVSIKDTFVFDRLAGSALTLRYANLYYGYQFIAIAGLRFTAPCI